MEKEIFYKAELQIDESENIIVVEGRLKEFFFDVKISKKKSFLIVELSCSYDVKFSLDDIESFIYIELSRILNFYELKLLIMKEEVQIYNTDS